VVAAARAGGFVEATARDVAAANGEYWNFATASLIGNPLFLDYAGSSTVFSGRGGGLVRPIFIWSWFFLPPPEIMLALCAIWWFTDRGNHPMDHFCGRIAADLSHRPITHKTTIRPTPCRRAVGIQAAVRCA